MQLRGMHKLVTSTKLISGRSRNTTTNERKYQLQLQYGILHGNKTHSREGPTRATLSLVLDGGHCTLLPPVNTCGHHNIVIRLNEGGTSEGSAGPVASSSAVPAEAIHGCHKFMMELQNISGYELQFIHITKALQVQ